MKASELRIGNYVFGCYETEPEEENEESQELEVLCKFIGYDPFEKYLWVESVDGLDYEFSNFRPIPLTEEWLVGCGFVKDREYSEYYTKDGFFDIWFNKKKGLYTIGHYDMDNVDIADVEYVHELQNAYQVIKREELHPVEQL